ncbi:MAG: dihydroxyacetone kinase subunit DhaL [Alphaproteobacteria bacterium]|nr:dihydroxyacetone kinase subunit DhaL [Alphaproteobacteria bacterium]
MKELTESQVVEMLREVSKALIDKVDVLTDADLATGDGDHGIGMRRGCEAALEGLVPGLSVQDAFKKTGMAIMSKTGGAAGAVFGTFFRGGAGAFAEAKTLDAARFADFLAQSAQAVSKRGGVEEGAKTMVDAVMPAARAVEAEASDDLLVVFTAAERGALDGVEASKAMIATTGKARSLGERSIGHPDPGAISVSIILGAMKSYAASL